MQSPAWLNLPATGTEKADESVKKRKALASGAASSGGEAGAGHSRGLVEVLAKSLDALAISTMREFT
jgi:hypothetical protein